MPQRPTNNDWDAWGEPSKPAPLDMKKIDYNSLNLNKLSDVELNRHKEAMDLMYKKNFVSKNDPTFEYDKQVDFSKVKKVEASWDDD